MEKERTKYMLPAQKKLLGTLYLGAGNVFFTQITVVQLGALSAILIVLNGYLAEREGVDPRHLERNGEAC